MIKVKAFLLSILFIIIYFIAEVVVLFARNFIHPLNFFLGGCRELSLGTDCYTVLALDNIFNNIQILMPIAIAVSLLYTFVCSLALVYLAFRIFKYPPWLLYIKSNYFNNTVILFFIYVIIRNILLYFEIIQPYYSDPNPFFKPLNFAIETMMSMFIYLKFYRKHCENSNLVPS